MTNWFQPEGAAISCVDLLVTGTATFTGQQVVSGLTVNGNETINGALTIKTGAGSGLGPPWAGGTSLVQDAAGDVFYTIASTTVKGILFANTSSLADGGVIYDQVARTMELRAAGNITKVQVSALGTEIMPGTGIFTGDNSTIVNLGATVLVTGSNFVTTSLSLVDITGLQAPVFAGGIYKYTAVIELASSSAAGLVLAINTGVGGSSFEGQIIGTGISPTRMHTLGTASPAIVLAAADGAAHLNGIFTCGGSNGILSVQMAKVTSGNATAYINSYFDVVRIA